MDHSRGGFSSSRFGSFHQPVKANHNVSSNSSQVNAKDDALGPSAAIVQPVSMLTPHTRHSPVRRRSPVTTTAAPKVRKSPDYIGSHGSPSIQRSIVATAERASGAKPPVSSVRATKASDVRAERGSPLKIQWTFSTPPRTRGNDGAFLHVQHPSPSHSSKQVQSDTAQFSQLNGESLRAQVEKSQAHGTGDMGDSRKFYNGGMRTSAESDKNSCDAATQTSTEEALTVASSDVTSQTAADTTDVYSEVSSFSEVSDEPSTAELLRLERSNFTSRRRGHRHQNSLDAHPELQKLLLQQQAAARKIPNPVEESEFLPSYSPAALRWDKKLTTSPVSRLADLGDVKSQLSEIEDELQSTNQRAGLTREAGRRAPAPDAVTLMSNAIAHARSIGVPGYKPEPGTEFFSSSPIRNGSFLLAGLKPGEEQKGSHYPSSRKTETESEKSD